MVGQGGMKGGWLMRIAEEANEVKLSRNGMKLTMKMILAIDNDETICGG